MILMSYTQDDLTNTVFCVNECSKSLRRAYADFHRTPSATNYAELEKWMLAYQQEKWKAAEIRVALKAEAAA
jgi:hypothetical protein